MVEAIEIKNAHDEVVNALLAYGTEFHREHPNRGFLRKYEKEFENAHDKYMALTA